MKVYLDMLIASMDKKIELLDQIIEFDKQELNMLSAAQFDFEAFDKHSDQRVTLADRISKLDEGFEQVYDRVREGLVRDKELYHDEIARLQEQIQIVTEKCVSAQALESRIALAFRNQERKAREQLAQKRSSNRAAQSYFQNMRKLNFVDSQFLDRRN